jgi:single-strand DNA-binding protein
MYINRLTIMGFLGNDAEKKSTPSGKTFTQFSIATKSSWKDEKGEWQSITEWHRAIVWGEKLAEFAATLKKGAHVHVEGQIRSREFEKDGVKHRVWDCRVDSILKLDRAERAEQPSNAAEEMAEVPF